MSVLHIMSGIPGSGKTHYCNQWANKNDTILHRDELRQFLREYYKSDSYFSIEETLEKEWLIFMSAYNAIIALDRNKSVWIDATMLDSIKIAEFINKLNTRVDLNRFNGIMVHCLHTPFNICKERNSKRSKMTRVPDNVMDSMRASFNINTEEIKRNIKNKSIANSISIIHIPN